MSQEQIDDIKDAIKELRTDMKSMMRSTYLLVGGAAIIGPLLLILTEKVLG